MLEEFVVLLTSSWIIVWPSLERLVSPSVAPQLQDEAPTETAPQLEDEDPAAVVSCALRTPPPRPIHWAVDSPPVDTHPTEDNVDSTKCRLDSFINEVTRKRDSPLIREPPKQPPASDAVAEQAVGGSAPLSSTCFQAR